jgi:hypothetical protein
MVVWNLHSLLYIHRGVRYRQLKINDVMSILLPFADSAHRTRWTAAGTGTDGDATKPNPGVTQPPC